MARGQGAGRGVLAAGRDTDHQTSRQVDGTPGGDQARGAFSARARFGAGRQDARTIHAHGHQLFNRRHDLHRGQAQRVGQDANGLRPTIAKAQTKRQCGRPVYAVETCGACVDRKRQVQCSRGRGHPLRRERAARDQHQAGKSTRVSWHGFILP